jgi:hypothetical protein
LIFWICSIIKESDVLRYFRQIISQRRIYFPNDGRFCRFMMEKDVPGALINIPIAAIGKFIAPPGKEPDATGIREGTVFQ